MIEVMDMGLKSEGASGAATLGTGRTDADFHCVGTSDEVRDSWYIFPPHLVSVSTLPCTTKNTEIMSFHLNVVRCFANRHTIGLYSLNLSPGHR